MCQSCPPDPVAYVEEILTRMRFAVVHVHGSRVSPDLGYTVGLTRHGLPELAVSGQRHETTLRLLSLWGDYLLDESQVLAGERLTCGPWDLEAVRVDHAQDHLLVAARLYGDRLSALQLAWADARGRWPWEPGHRARQAGQAVLGTPAPWLCDEHRPDRLEVPDAP